MPTPIRFKGIVGTTAEIATDRFAGRIAFDSTLARFVMFFDATNYAINARRDVLETFAAGIQDSTLTAGLPMYASTSGRHATEAVAAFRTRIGVAGAERINRSLKSATASGWLKLATVKVTATAHVSSFMAEVVSVGRSTGTTDTQRVRLFARLKQNSAMSSPLDIIQCEYTSEGGASFTLGYVVEQDDATEKRVSIYVGANSSTHYVRFTVLSAYSNAAGNAPVFFEDPTPLASQPTPWVDASLATLSAATINATSAIQTSGVTRISSGGAGTLTTLSTTGLATLAQATVSDLTTGRMVSTTTAGRLQALDASGSRSLIGAYGSGDNVSLGAIEKVVSSTTESVSGNIYNQYTTVTQTGIVTQQSLAGTGAGSRTIGAGRLDSQGSGMNIYLCGTYTTDASPGSATLRIRIGSTTFRTIGSFTLDSNITNGIWYIRGRITTRTTGASGTVGGQIVWEHMGSTVAGAEVMHIQPATSAADVTVDLTASQTIDVDWTATDAGTIITCSCFAIDLIR